MGKREEYIDRLAAQLKVWCAEIDALKAKAGKEAVDIKIAIHKEIEVLSKKMQDMQKKLQNIKERTGDAWESLEEESNKAWKDLKEAVCRAGDKFK